MAQPEPGRPRLSFRLDQPPSKIKRRRVLPPPVPQVERPPAEDPAELPELHLEPEGWLDLLAARHKRKQRQADSQPGRLAPRSGLIDEHEVPTSLVVRLFPGSFTVCPGADRNAKGQRLLYGPSTTPFIESLDGGRLALPVELRDELPAGYWREGGLMIELHDLRGSSGPTCKQSFVWPTDWTAAEDAHWLHAELPEADPLELESAMVLHGAGPLLLDPNPDAIFAR